MHLAVAQSGEKAVPLPTGSRAPATGGSAGEAGVFRQWLAAQWASAQPAAGATDSTAAEGNSAGREASQKAATLEMDGTGESAGRQKVWEPAATPSVSQPSSQTGSAPASASLARTQAAVLPDAVVAETTVPSAQAPMAQETDSAAPQSGDAPGPAGQGVASKDSVSEAHGARPARLGATQRSTGERMSAESPAAGKAGAAQAAPIGTGQWSAGGVTVSAGPSSDAGSAAAAQKGTGPGESVTVHRGPASERAAASGVAPGAGGSAARSGESGSAAAATEAPSQASAAVVPRASGEAGDAKSSIGRAGEPSAPGSDAGPVISSEPTATDSLTEREPVRAAVPSQGANGKGVATVSRPEKKITQTAARAQGATETQTAAAPAQPLAAPAAVVPVAPIVSPGASGASYVARAESRTGLVLPAAASTPTRPTVAGPARTAASAATPALSESLASGQPVPAARVTQTAGRPLLETPVSRTVPATPAAAATAGQHGTASPPASSVAAGPGTTVAQPASHGVPSSAPVAAPASVSGSAAQATTALSGTAFDRIDSAAAPQVLHRTPQRLEVGVSDPGLGWVEIRARATDGQIAATVSASSETHPALAAELPAMRDYLAGQQVRVDTLNAQPFEAAADGGRSSQQNPGRATPDATGDAAGLPGFSTEAEPESLSWIDIRV